MTTTHLALASHRRTPSGRTIKLSERRTVVVRPNSKRLHLDRLARLVVDGELDLQDGNEDGRAMSA